MYVGVRKWPSTLFFASGPKYSILYPLSPNQALAKERDPHLSEVGRTVQGKDMWNTEINYVTKTA